MWVISVNYAVCPEHRFSIAVNACQGGRLAEQFLRDRNIQLDSFCGLDALETISLLVAEQVGTSVVPAWPGITGQQLGLSTTKLGDSKYNRQIVLLSHYHPKRPKVTEKLLELLREEKT